MVVLPIWVVLYSHNMVVLPIWMVLYSQNMDVFIIVRTSACVNADRAPTA